MTSISHQPGGDSSTRREAAQLFLTELGLNSAEQAALARRGFVSREVRGRRIVYKLRFRVDGRQRVRYLGTDAERVRLVEEALRALQVDRRLELSLRRRHREVAARLRESKQRLIGPLEAAGFYFHGRAVRRPRSPTNSGEI